MSLAAVAPAAGQTVNQFVAFGDSTIDSGYYRVLVNPQGAGITDAQWAAAVAAGAGVPTTSPGLMNSQFLASYFGLTALPSNQGGANYATSGAKDVDPNGLVNGGFAAAVPTVTQIANYLAAVSGHANSDALYLISSGGNDISFATGNSGTGPYPSPASTYLINAADSLASAIAQLQSDGARYIIVRGLNFSFGDATTQADRLLYTQTLWSALAAAGVNFIPSDYNAVRLAIAANPLSFGFLYIDNTTNFACTQPAGVTTAWALLCSSNPGAPSMLVTPDAEQTRLFADDQHLTTAGQKIVADYEYSLVVAPSEISYLAEVPVKMRAGVVNAILNQIPISFTQLGRFHGWATGDIASLKMSNETGFPSDPGTPVNVTAGFDYRLNQDWLVGAAFSLGQTTQTFSLGGNFKDTEFAASLYAGYRNEPYWFNVIATWGTLNFDVNRQVPIGITVQANQGSTSGSNISLAFEDGYDFMTSLSGHPVTHGPLAGMVLQRVDVKGFTETDQFAAIGGFTALSFGDQTRNSAVGELGYQASIDLGVWQPFAKLTWNHEFADTDRLVTASLTSTVAPSYSLPAVELGKDWGTGIVGTRFKIGADATAYAAFIGQVAQQHVVDYGGQIGINMALPHS